MTGCNALTMHADHAISEKIFMHCNQPDLFESNRVNKLPAEMTGQ